MAAALLMDQTEVPSPSLYELVPDATHWDLQFTTSGSFSGLLDELLVDGDQWVAPPPPPPTARARRDEPLEALTEALVAISLHRKDFLAQVWAPATSDKLLLTTKDQPFCCDDSGDLLRYRALSTGYVFPVSQGRHVMPGLPGRVFTRLTPEWSPNVQFYDSREYLRVRDAASCNIKGTLAVPVINPSSHNCIAVIELVAKVEKVDYGDEMAIICGALQAVNLSSSIDSATGFFLPEVPREAREQVFDEISQALQKICRAHKLPLAQTWVPVDLVGDHSDAPQSSSSSSSSRHGRRLVARGTPYYLGDNSLSGFRQACLEQSLERGQGIAGRAFTSNQPSFVEDIRKLSIDEYPLVHCARYFELVAAVGVRLRSVLTGSEDYVLEFFLPLDCVNKQEQQKIINELSITMQCACRGLRTLTNKELRQDRNGLVVGDSDARTSSSGKKKSSSLREEDVVEVDDSVTSNTAATHKNKKAKKVEFDERTAAATAASESYWSETSLPDVPTKRRLEKKRVTSEKTVALEVLQRYFAGSLKDAAKSLGVCPTTLKRICRQYGIARWPSRKINKVSRSLEKLKTVIDSVEGIDRTVKLDALNGELARATANLTKASQGDHADDMSTICSSATDLKMVLDTAATPYTPTPLEAAEMVPPIVKVEPRVHGCSTAFTALGINLQIPLEQQLPRTASFDNFTNFLGAAYPEDLSARFQQAEAPATTVTIKVKYGLDTARFKLPVGFDYQRLTEEVSAKFKLDGSGAFGLKYLDDDQEWVMLNSDEDLNECLDVMKTTNEHTIRLVVLDASICTYQVSMNFEDFWSPCRRKLRSSI